MEQLLSRHRDYAILVAVGIALAIVPFLLNQFHLTVAITMLYWAYLGSAWDIMGGYAGQFSFGHAAFYGIGAYTSTVLLVDYDISPWVGMFVGALLAGLFGIVVGFLFFQFGLKGHFFALGTFAFAEMLRLIATELEIVNTSVGIHIPLVEGDSWARMQFNDTRRNFYFIILAMLLIIILIRILIVHSKLGYYFLAIREDEDAAAALGVDNLSYKIASVAISGALTAMGGSFFIQFFGFVDPGLAFGVAVSIDILLRPIVGGTGTIWGPLAGAILLEPLAEFTRTFVRNPPGFLEFIEGSSGVDVMLFGALLIIFVLFVPNGVIGLFPQIWRRVKPS